MTLVELAKVATKMRYSKQQIVNELKNVAMFEPIDSDEGIKNRLYRITDGNSWLEVSKLVDEGIITEDEYFQFCKIVNDTDAETKIYKIGVK